MTLALKVLRVSAIVSAICISLASSGYAAECACPFAPQGTENCYNDPTNGVPKVFRLQSASCPTLACPTTDKCTFVCLGPDAKGNPIWNKLVVSCSKTPGTPVPTPTIKPPSTPMPVCYCDVNKALIPQGCDRSRINLDSANCFGSLQCGGGCSGYCYDTISGKALPVQPFPCTLKDPRLVMTPPPSTPTASVPGTTTLMPNPTATALPMTPTASAASASLW